MNQAIEKTQLKKASEVLETPKVSKENPEDIQAFTGIRANTVVSVGARVLEMAEQPKFRVETYRSCDLSPELIQDFSEFYREIFCNAPYNQFLFHISDPLTPISPQEAFGRPDQKYFTLEELDTFELPDGMRRWIDPQKCLEINEAKLMDNAFITRLVGCEGKTRGLVYGRAASLQKVFETEEMKNPLLFADYHDDSLLADEKKFFDKMNYHFGVDGNDNVFYISCQALHPSGQGIDNFHMLMKQFLASLPVQYFDEFFFAEVPLQGAGSAFNTAACDRKVYGILENGHFIVACKSFKDYAKHFLGSKSDLFELARNFLKNEKAPFLQHPKNNLKVEVKYTEDFGRAVFAKDSIQAGETIAVFDGEKYMADSALDLPSIMVNHAMQIGENEYIHAHKQLVELINHSCGPNCGMRNFTEVFALRDIQPGEQLTWDYRMTEDSNWQLDECKCGSEHCCGIVGGFSTLPQHRREEYLRKGAISPWLLEKHGLILPETTE